MKKLFEEYGDIIIAIVVITALVLVFKGIIDSATVKTQITTLLTNFFNTVTPTT